MLAELPALNIERILLNLGERKTLKPLPIKNSLESEEQVKMAEYNNCDGKKIPNGIEDGPIK